MNKVSSKHVSSLELAPLIELFKDALNSIFIEKPIDSHKRMGNHGITMQNLKVVNACILFIRGRIST